MSDESIAIINIDLKCVIYQYNALEIKLGKYTLN